MFSSDIDLDLKFILKKPIEFNGIGTLHPILVSEIIDVGYEVYNKSLSLLCVSAEDIKSSLNLALEQDIEIEPFDFLFENAKYSEDFKNELIGALSLFFKDSIIIDEELSSFFIGEDGSLHRDNFNFIVDILAKQNCIEPQMSGLTAKNKSEKEYFEKLKKAREKYRVQNGVELTDIISSVCAKHPSISLLNVGELSIYQLIDQYRRLNHIDEFYIAINSLMHGASQDGVRVVHWSDKYKK